NAFLIEGMERWRAKNEPLLVRVSRDRLSPLMPRSAHATAAAGKHQHADLARGQGAGLQSSLGRTGRVLSNVNDATEQSFARTHSAVRALRAAEGGCDACGKPCVYQQVQLLWGN
ncbi:MAG TPA: hypothetical protein VMG13_02250, partial [Trebonia sp.]|nr:hypothetical protein [Trebonia sp.]